MTQQTYGFNYIAIELVLVHVIYIPVKFNIEEYLYVPIVFIYFVEIKDLKFFN